MKPPLPDGIAVLFCNGGPDIPGVVTHQTPTNDALKPFVRVRFAHSTAWIDPAQVRVMQLADHQRVYGQRFCDWQYVLWSTLIFHFARGFETLARAQLAAWWRDGWSEAAAAKHLAATHGWACYDPQAHLSAPAHMRPFVTDLGDRLRADTAHR